jgi:uncharacterized protein (DUF305 family)
MSVRAARRVARLATSTGTEPPMSTTSRRHVSWLSMLSAVLLVTACSGGGEPRDTTIAAPAATMGAGANPADTGMGATSHGMVGMDHGAMANRAAPRDSNQSFLRMMSDHHQGLVVMSDSAMGKLGASVKADAQKVRTDQQKEIDHMLQMLRSDFKDSITPMIMPSNQTMISTVARASAGDADRVYYEQVIAHHREGIQMVDKMLPHLSGMSKDMASTARTKQQKEITEFEKKAAPRS